METFSKFVVLATNCCKSQPVPAVFINKWPNLIGMGRDMKNLGYSELKDWLDQ